MDDLKEEVIQDELQHRDAAANIDDFFEPESRLSKYIPGGYSPSRCLPFQGRTMMYAVLCLAGLSILFFGYDASVMSQVNTNKDYLTLMGAASGSNRDAAAVGGIVSVWFGGFGIGALLVGLYADKIGRLKTIELGCLWALLGAALQASAKNITWMMFARVVGGIGCGHLNTIVPIWTSEIADPHLRGAFVAVEFTLALVGSTIVYWMEYGCAQTQSAEFAWRFPVAFQAVPLLIILVLTPFYPESPRHLAKRGRLSEAQDILTRCRIRPDAEQISREMVGIKEAIRLEATSTAHSFATMLFQKDKLHTRRRILLGAGVQVMQKFTGIDFIATYAPEMFALSGYGKNESALLAGGNFITYSASLAVSIWLSDKLGRRTNMLLGSSLMGLVLIAGAICSHEVEVYADTDPAKAKRIGAGVVTILYLYTIIYGGTWLTTCWVVSNIPPPLTHQHHRLSADASTSTPPKSSPSPPAPKAPPSPPSPSPSPAV